MFEKAVQKLVDNQIERGALKEEDRNIYRYGYQVMIEFCINIVVSIAIAVIFRAFEIVVVFTIAYLLIRGYAGGYHARTSLGCFCMSAFMLIIVILIVRFVDTRNPAWWMLLIPEAVMTPLIFKYTPLPVKNKPVSENERIYFKKKMRQIYCIELTTALALLFLGNTTCTMSILAVHIVLFIMVVIQILKNQKAARAAV